MIGGEGQMPISLPGAQPDINNRYLTVGPRFLTTMQVPIVEGRDIDEQQGPGLGLHHALGDALGGSDRAVLAAFVDSVDRWIAERLRADDANANANLPRLARLAEVWEKISRAARDTAEYNLERKPLVFSVFGLLAEATR